MEFRKFCDISFENYTLLLPSVSVGNVGQLTCDLIISSLKLQKVGYFWSTLVLPIIGANPFSLEEDDSLTVSIEVFSDKTKKLAVLQQRAPMVAGKQEEYTSKLISWIKTMKFQEVVMVTSCHAYERLDEEILGSPVKYLLSPQNDKISETLQEVCHLKKLQKRKSEYGEEIYLMPGGGIAKSFFEKCDSTDSNFTLAILMIFCSEGDNIPEAVTMANTINLWKKYMQHDKDSKSNQQQLIFPTSWKYMYGSRQPSAIF